MQKEIRKNFVVGAINTTIRNVNELCGEEVIKMDWRSITLSNGELQAFLTVNGVEKILAFPSQDWLTSTSFTNVYKKTTDLEKELTANIS